MSRNDDGGSGKQEHQRGRPAGNPPWQPPLPVQKKPAPGKATLEDVEGGGASRNAAPASADAEAIQFAGEAGERVTGGAWEADAALMAAMGLGEDDAASTGQGAQAVRSGDPGTPVQRHAVEGHGTAATDGAWEFDAGLAAAMGLADAAAGAAVQRREVAKPAAPGGGDLDKERAPASTDRPAAESMMETRATIDDSANEIAGGPASANEGEEGAAVGEEAQDPRRAPASTDRPAAESMIEMRATIDDTDDEPADTVRDAAPPNIDRPAEESMMESRATIDDRPAEADTAQQEQAGLRALAPTIRSTRSGSWSSMR